MSLRHDLLYPGDQISRAGRWIVRRQVIDRIVRENHIADIRLRQDIMLKAVLGPAPCSIAQQLIPTDALIEDPYIQPGRHQSSGEIVCPAGICVEARIDSIGDGSAQSNDRPGRGSVLHVQTGEKEIAAILRHRADTRLVTYITCSYIAALVATLVDGIVGDGGRHWEVDADRIVGQGIDSHGNRIACYFRLRCHCYTGLTAEFYGMICSCNCG